MSSRNGATKPKSGTSKPRTTAKTSKSANPDELADALASKLKISSRSKAPTQSPKDIKAEAMRALNSAMQSLGDLARAGWKKSAQESSPTWRTRHAEANTLASTSRENLKLLRGTDSPTMDVERAALSVAGKLVALDMVRGVKRREMFDSHAA